MPKQPPGQKAKTRSPGLNSLTLAPTHTGDDPGHVEPGLIVRDNPHGNQDAAEIEPDGLGLDLDLISEAAAGDASSLWYNDSMSPILSHPQGFDRLLALETLKRELICQGEGVVSTDAYCIWPR